MVEPGVPAVTVDPPEEAWPMLRLRADEKGRYLIKQTESYYNTCLCARKHKMKL